MSVDREPDDFSDIKDETDRHIWLAQLIAEFITPEDDQLELFARVIKLYEVSLSAPTTATRPEREAQEAVAWRDVLAERQRQIETEGWTPDHDDAHQSGELADAAALYASIKVRHVSGMAVWPWEPEWFKPTSGAVPGSRRRDIVKACALLLAEIERLDRLSALTQLEARDVG